MFDNLTPSIERAVRVSFPFPHLVIENTFSDDESRALLATLPVKNMVRVANTGIKSYTMDYLALPLDCTELASPWTSLLRVIKSKKYAAALAMLSEVKLEPLVPQVAVWRYCQGDFLARHTDKQEKLLSHVMYLVDPDASPIQGGELRLFETRDTLEPAVSYDPCPGRSIVLPRSDRSWHEVAIVSGSAPRYSIQVVFAREFDEN